MATLQPEFKTNADGNTPAGIQNYGRWENSCGRNIAALNKTQNKKGTNNEFKNMFRNIELHPQQNTLYKIAS